MTASATTGRSADRSAKNQTRYFSVPLDLAARIDAAAKARGITKSALFREIFRAWEAWDRETRRGPSGKRPENEEETGGEI